MLFLVSNGSWRALELLALMTLGVSLAGSVRSQPTGQGGILVVSNRIPQAGIELGKHPTEVEQFAAEELRKYIKAVSGAELPMVTPGSSETVSCKIVLGTPASNALVAKLQADGGARSFGTNPPGLDSLLLATAQADRQPVLVLAGNRPRAVLFAVYAFLEDCLGVRFFGFGPSQEIIPVQPTIRLARLDRLETSRFKFRIANNNNFPSNNRKMLVTVADWAAKNRFNTFLLPVDDERQLPLAELTRRGMELWGGGHVWSRLTPAKTLFTTHPEYFPLINGKRTFCGNQRTISFCYSNPHAMDVFVANALAFARQHPRLNVFACWPEDGSQHWAQCQCDGCRRYTFSDWNLAIANELARAFERDPILHPMRIQWIAYNETSVPPSKVSPYHGGRNLDLLYANCARDFLAPLNSAANRKCAPWLLHDQLRTKVDTDFNPSPTDDDLAGYQRLTNMLAYLKHCDYQGNLSLLEYVNAHVGYWLDLPYLQNVDTGPWDSKVFPSDLQFYLSAGISGWSDCFDWPNDNPNPFWNRLMARLLWDPCTDVRALKADFYGNYYGAAGKLMQAYFDDLWALLYSEKPRWEDYPKLKSLGLRLQQARQACDPGSAVAKRLVRVISWHNSLRLAKPSSNLLGDGSFEGVPLAEGESRSCPVSLELRPRGDWKLVHPASNSMSQPVEGLNLLQCSGKNCSLQIWSADYVFEARTSYRLEVNVFSASRNASLALAAMPLRTNKEAAILAKKLLSGLKPGKWNRIDMEWQCKPGAPEEGKSVGILCERFEDTAIDQVVLKAHVSK